LESAKNCCDSDSGAPQVVVQPTGGCVRNWPASFLSLFRKAAFPMKSRLDDFAGSCAVGERDVRLAEAEFHESRSDALRILRGGANREIDVPGSHRYIRRKRRPRLGRPGRSDGRADICPSISSYRLPSSGMHSTSAWVRRRLLILHRPSGRARTTSVPPVSSRRRRYPARRASRTAAKDSSASWPMPQSPCGSP